MSASTTRPQAVPTLPKAPLPLEQLTQLQRRMAHMLTSLSELQEHVGNAQSLDEWPLLLSRHLTLVSQTQSLVQFMSLANPNSLNVQLAHRDEALLEESHQQNKFSGATADDDGGPPGAASGAGSSSRAHDALFGGKANADLEQELETPTTDAKLPRVQYSSGDDNPLTRLAPHPFFPLDAEKSQTVIPSLLLPRGIDGKVTQDAQARWDSWLRTYAGVPDATAAAKADIDEKRKWIDTLHDQIHRYDSFAQQALRSWIHAREATDDLGQRYDWRMRLAADEDSDEEIEEEPELGGDVSMNAESDRQDKKRKRDTDAEKDEGNRLTIDQVRSLLHSGEL